jgi:hypothetical protein
MKTAPAATTRMIKTFPTSATIEAMRRLRKEITKSVSRQSRSAKMIRGAKRATGEARGSNPVEEEI